MKTYILIIFFILLTIQGVENKQKKNKEPKQYNHKKGSQKNTHHSSKNHSQNDVVKQERELKQKEQLKNKQQEQDKLQQERNQQEQILKEKQQQEQIQRIKNEQDQKQKEQQKQEQIQKLKNEQKQKEQQKQKSSNKDNERAQFVNEKKNYQNDVNNYLQSTKNIFLEKNQSILYHLENFAQTQILSTYQKIKQNETMLLIFFTVIYILLISIFFKILCPTKTTQKLNSQQNLNINKIESLFVELKDTMNNQGKQMEQIKVQLIELKLQEGKNQDKEEDFIEFFEKNLTDVWREIGNIKQKVNDQDQSQFTYPGSLNNDLVKNKEDLDCSEIKKDENLKTDRNILSSINPPLSNKGKDKEINQVTNLKNLSEKKKQPLLPPPLSTNLNNQNQNEKKIGNILSSLQQEPLQNVKEQIQNKEQPIKNNIIEQNEETNIQQTQVNEQQQKPKQLRLPGQNNKQLSKKPPMKLPKMNNQKNTTRKQIPRIKPPNFNQIIQQEEQKQDNEKIQDQNLQQQEEQNLQKDQTQIQEQIVEKNETEIKEQNQENQQQEKDQIINEQQNIDQNQEQQNAVEEAKNDQNLIEEKIEQKNPFILQNQQQVQQEENIPKEEENIIEQTPNQKSNPFFNKIKNEENVDQNNENQQEESNEKQEQIIQEQEQIKEVQNNIPQQNPINPFTPKKIDNPNKQENEEKKLQIKPNLPPLPRKVPNIPTKNLKKSKKTFPNVRAPIPPPQQQRTNNNQNSMIQII